MTGKLIDIVIVLLNLLICGIYIAETYVETSAACAFTTKTPRTANRVVT